MDGEPCNECEACRGIDEGTLLDITELDAASNNGVDHVRALREEAVYTPAVLKKRVYIIDEVHMLSTPAFNALLKILEEPPEHLVFILATTELHKVDVYKRQLYGHAGACLKGRSLFKRGGTSLHSARSCMRQRELCETIQTKSAVPAAQRSLRL